MLGGYTTLNSPSLQTVPQDGDTIVVKPIDSPVLVASGKFEGISSINRYGFNPDIDTGSTPEDIWGGGGLYTGFPTATLETVDIVSTSANDTAAGTGARTVYITGLDTNYAVQSETLTLNGVAKVTSANTYRRVNYAYVVSAGSGGVNAGDLTLCHTTTTANVFFVLRTGTNQTQESAYTIPAGYTGYLRHIEATVYNNASSVGLMSIWTRPYGNAVRFRRPFSCGTGFAFVSDIYGGLQLTEKTDLVIRCDGITANNSQVSVGYDIVLVKNV